MRLKYQVNFTLERRKDKKTGQLIASNVPINMVVTYQSKRLVYYTGYRTDRNNWIDKAEGIRIQKVKKNTVNKDGISASEINASLRNLNTRVDEIFLDYGKMPPTLAQLRSEIKKEQPGQINSLDLIQCFDKYIDTIKVSEGRKNHLKVTKNLVNNFIKKKSININEVTTDFLYSFQKFLRTYKNERSQNTITAKLKMFRAFINYAYKEGWIKDNPFKKFSITREEYGDPIFLTKTERDKLYNLELNDKRLDRVRDMFVLQCFIGCRIGDFVKLKHSNIIDGFIHYVPGKTSDENQRVCKVPLTSKAKAIIDKYDLPDGSLVPYISGQKYNEYLKELFRFAELNRTVVRLNPLTRQNESVKLHEVASSHMARRTFIGILHKTAKDSVIASMSGHVKNSKAFSRYYNVDEEDQLKAIKDIE